MAAIVILILGVSILSVQWYMDDKYDREAADVAVRSDDNQDPPA